PCGPPSAYVTAFQRWRRPFWRHRPARRRSRRRRSTPVLWVGGPKPCGVWGDAMALVHEPGGRVTSVHGAGRWSEAAGSLRIRDDASAVTVPGAAQAWGLLVERFGRRSLAENLLPAIGLAERGFRPDDALAEALEGGRARLERGGAGGWSLLRSAAAHTAVPQPELART